MNRQSLLALIHCAAKDLCLSEDTYRAILERIGGASSAKHLSNEELGKVADHFRTLGWKPKSGKRFSDKPHVRKIWALWGEMCRKKLVRTPTRAALRSFCTRVTGVGDPEWLSPSQANAVIESLKIWKEREERR